MSTKRLVIGIDGRYLGGPLTGVPRYIHELCVELDRQIEHAEFIIYAQNSEGIKLPSARWTIKAETNKFFASIKPNLWLKLRLGHLIEKDNLDVFWAAAGLLAGFLSRVPQVLTVYDFTFRLYPETMSRGNLWAYRIFFRGDLRRATRVTAISNGTNERMQQFFNRAADAIVKPAATDRFSRASSDECAAVKIKYQIDSPFILAVSTLEPRKNFSSLIKAFIELKNLGKIPKHKLILIGKKGWRDSALAKQIAAKDCDQIHSLGFVSDEDLPALYSSCEVFCMPSLYEGFGMPVLEARLCGAKVVATSIKEIIEAGGPEAHYCDPDPDSIAKAISEALEATKNSTVSSNLSWQRGCEILISELVVASKTKSMK